MKMPPEDQLRECHAELDAHSRVIRNPKDTDDLLWRVRGQTYAHAKAVTTSVQTRERMECWRKVAMALGASAHLPTAVVQARATGRFEEQPRHDPSEELSLTLHPRIAGDVLSWLEDSDSPHAAAFAANRTDPPQPFSLPFETWVEITQGLYGHARQFGGSWMAAANGLARFLEGQETGRFAQGIWLPHRASLADELAPFARPLPSSIN